MVVFLRQFLCSTLIFRSLCGRWESGAWRDDWGGVWFCFCSVLGQNGTVLELIIEKHIHFSWQWDSQKVLKQMCNIALPQWQWKKNQCWWGLLQIFSFSTVPLSNPRTTGYWDEQQPVQLLGFCWNWPNFVRCSQDRDTSLPKKVQSKILGCLAHSCQVWATPVGTERFGRVLFDSPLNPQLFSLWKGHSCSSRLVCKCWTGGRWSSTDQCVFYGWSCLCVCFPVF